MREGALHPYVASSGRQAVDHSNRTSNGRPVQTDHAQRVVEGGRLVVGRWRVVWSSRRDHVRRGFRRRGGGAGRTDKAGARGGVWLEEVWTKIWPLVH
ncbi:hypothetical protein GW17_00013275 [Ensete ventricosum]|nr:hypothetical protein GW17_00013275 [Ensete ventricosum]